MQTRHHCTPVRHGRRTLALALLLCSAATGAAGADLAEPSCMLACKTATSCGVQRDGQGEALQLNSQRFTPTGACNTLKVAADEVVLRYRHKGRWFDPPLALTGQRHLKDVFEQFKADVCGVPTLACLQLRMGAKSASTAGHGADSLATSPAGSGDPCVLGLPCGTVLPPAAQWRFRLADATVSGRWQARYLRGTPPAGMPADINAAVAQGEVVVDGSYFQPGAVIAYRLTGTSGALRASGEFEVASNARLARLKSLAAARAERFGLSEPAAWLDALASAELDWDVQQLLADR